MDINKIETAIKAKSTLSYYKQLIDKLNYKEGPKSLSIDFGGRNVDVSIRDHELIGVAINAMIYVINKRIEEQCKLIESL